MNRYGPMIVSAAIIALFALARLGIGVPLDDASAKLMDMCLTLVMGYWLGSSHTPPPEH